MKLKNMARLTITIPHEELIVIKEYCRSKAHTVSGLTRLVLKRFIENESRI